MKFIQCYKTILPHLKKERRKNQRLNLPEGAGIIRLGIWEDKSSLSYSSLAPEEGRWKPVDSSVVSLRVGKEWVYGTPPNSGPHYWDTCSWQGSQHLSLAGD